MPNIEPSTHPSIDEYSQHSEDRSQAHSTVAQVPPVALEYSPEQFDIALTYGAHPQLSEYNESPTNHAAFFDLVKSPKSDDWLSLPDAPWETHAVPYVPYDDLGRVHADAWMAARRNRDQLIPQQRPPCPEFLEEIIDKLRRRYRDIRIEGIMYLCLVCPTTRTPIYRPQDFPFNPDGFQHQFVPTVRCLDCADQVLFSVSPLQSLQPIKDHLNRADHWSVRANRRHEAWLAANGGFSWPSIRQLDCNSEALSGQTLLILAVKKHDVRVLGRLLNDGFKVQEKDSSQRSALHWACFLGRNDMAELLIRYGAQLDEQDSELQTPIDLALLTSGIAVAVSLVQMFAQIQREQSPRTCDTPLALACHIGQLAVVEAVVEAGADVNERRVNSPLELALRDATWPVVQLLLHAGAYTNTISQQDRVLLRNKRDGIFFGEESNYTDADNKVMLLKGYGLDLDATPSPITTPGLGLTIPSKQPWLHRI